MCSVHKTLDAGTYATGTYAEPRRGSETDSFYATSFSMKHLDGTYIKRKTHET